LSHDRRPHEAEAAAGRRRGLQSRSCSRVLAVPNVKAMIRTAAYHLVPSWLQRSGLRKGGTGGGNADAGGAFPASSWCPAVPSRSACSGLAYQPASAHVLASLLLRGQLRAALCAARGSCSCSQHYGAVRQAGRERPPLSCPLLRPTPRPEGVAHAPRCVSLSSGRTALCQCHRRMRRHCRWSCRRRLRWASTLQTGFAGKQRSYR
jgi:hypothetical protein